MHHDCWLFYQAVVPLSEECGLLEWVNNTCAYRTILNTLYKEKGCYYSMRECMEVYKAFNNRSVKVCILMCKICQI